VKELNARAISAYQGGEIKEAALMWQKALALDPQNKWIQNSLERVESELLTHKEAP
jgi:hypothetical protein